MPRIEVAGDIFMRKPRPTQGCRAGDDDDEIRVEVNLSLCASRIHIGGAEV